MQLWVVGELSTAERLRYSDAQWQQIQAAISVNPAIKTQYSHVHDDDLQFYYKVVQPDTPNATASGVVLSLTDRHQCRPPGGRRGRVAVPEGFGAVFGHSPHVPVIWYSPAAAPLSAASLR
jgi:hypothetical protein